ncbi:MAG: ligand-gated TonB-dependent outer rane channel [Verrucomicrobiales bacterium]|nr:ligand-gated TonB-dependent outer rane channel [Verrucomicrobiales bacterium]
MLLGSAFAAEPAVNQPDAGSKVMDLSIEELMRIEVTSVSKKKEQLSDAAAAIFVITQDDIRRSGATSIPEVLRLSPGLEVARQDSHTWAVSSRGFNDEFANQLLVLIDGRSVYTPLFAGVYWDVQDLILEDVQQIEVIRGPGATLWGANAVNGVINITTKSAKDTQGVLLTGGAGTEEQGFGARYGGKVGENGYYRVYGKWFNRDESVLQDGSESNDVWQMERGGFRYDWTPTEQNSLTLQGDIYAGTLDQSVTEAAFTPPYSSRNINDVNVSGGDLLGRFSHSFSDTSEIALKLYYDRTERDRVVFREARDTFDVDLQYHFQWGSRQDIVLGAGYNLTADNLDNRFTVSFDPTSRTDSLYSGFFQDEISIIPDRLKLTLGSKLEHNDYTGWEIQPSGRLSLKITDKQTAWFAASRAISTPSRAESDIRINQLAYPPGTFGPGTPAALVSQFGSTSIDSKELVGFDLGYRIQAHDKLTVDLATFYNIYDRQRSIDAGTPYPELTPVPHIVVPFTIGNLMEGESYGFEISTTWQATDWWRLRANYSFLKLQLHLKDGSLDPFNLEGAEQDSPVNQVGVRSYMDLPQHLEFDAGIRYVDSLDNRGVPSYVVGDVRLGWRPNKNWEFSITGQNLAGTHKEFAPSYIQTQTTKVETSVFAKVTYRF